jgi:hypothetical protein
MLLGLSFGELSGMVSSSFSKPFCQKILDAVNPHGNRCW